MEEMSVEEALQIIESRGGIPKEDDWVLMSAAVRLAKHVRELQAK